ncbi:hypothetical protein [Pseudomonas sp. Nvir]|uniref:hypothetical protein n=1 Tax=Pseudomonas sp. Nvir TaxID=2899657 RepID=UPI001E3FC324|nr:hypothetical protein [Pseudomonas sp. Nvir]CAH0650520.1 hypothetical protein PSNVIR_04820 [Pseudomonas sp. Nvir]
MSGVDSLPAEAVVALNLDQRRKLAGLVEAERRKASLWWTFLNEMRIRGELPVWVKTQDVGTAGDHDHWLQLREEVNKAMFGKVRHIALEGEPEWVGITLDGHQWGLTQRPSPLEAIQGTESVEQLQEKVLQHLSGDIALGSTNERKAS